MKLTPSGDDIVAKSTATPSKTSFVEKFLNDNPQSNVKAVNEAWTVAGMKGTIGSTLIQKMRSKMGLIGNLSATSKPKSAAMATTANKMSKTAGTPSKTSVVKELLQKNPQGNTRTANEMGRAVGIRRNTKTAVMVKPTEETTAVVNVQPRSNGSMVLNDLEAEIDRLMFKVMGLGDLAEIEGMLRQARRLLYAALNRGAR